LPSSASIHDLSWPDRCHGWRRLRFRRFYAAEDDLRRGFFSALSGGAAGRRQRRLLEDETIRLILSAGIAGDRAATGLEAMRHGKDYLSDKPGLVTSKNSPRSGAAGRDRRIYSILYSEHFDHALDGEGRRTGQGRSDRRGHQHRRARPHRIARRFGRTGSSSAPATVGS